MEAESEAVGMLVAGDGLENKFAQVRTSHHQHHHQHRSQGDDSVIPSLMDQCAIEVMHSEPAKEW